MRIRSLVLLLIATVLGGGVVCASMMVTMLTGLSRAERESGTASVAFQHVEELVHNGNELLGMLDILTSESSGEFVLTERLTRRCRDGIQTLGLLPGFAGTNYSADLEALLDQTLAMAMSIHGDDDPFLAIERYDHIAMKFVTELEELQSQSQALAAHDIQMLGDQRRFTRATLITASVLYFVLVGLGFNGMLRRLVTPVQQLAGAAERSMQLDEPFRLEPNGPLEVRALTRTVGAFVSSLESKVSERTEELAGARDAAVRALSRERKVASDLEEANLALEQLATTDKLTGLPNREVFNAHLAQLIKQSRRNVEQFAVLFFDFDRFKVVNDSLGHVVGDQLLVAIAERFRSELREADIVARFGGDEFIVLLTNLAEHSDAQLKATKLLEAFAKPHYLGEHQIYSTASIGLVTNEHEYEEPSEMVRDADAAMYQAKDNGRAQVVVFDDAMHADAMDRLTLETDLSKALHQGELRLMYQPIIGLETGEVKGFEALIRWDHPKRGLISPVDFIPIAEESGLIVDIGRWVIQTAVAQVDLWNQHGPLSHRLSVSVNISKRQLLNSKFIDEVVECQVNSGLSPREIKLEITESTIADERSNVIPLLRQLREIGFLIVMDDFGTGVSSLSALHECPIDVLKIDQAFIRVLKGNRSLLAIVASITTLAENLGIQTVAEGIESGDILGSLQSIDCTWGQGYYFAKPMTPVDAEAYMRNSRSRRRIA